MRFSRGLRCCYFSPLLFNRDEQIAFSSTTLEQVDNQEILLPDTSSVMSVSIASSKWSLLKKHILRRAHVSACTIISFDFKVKFLHRSPRILLLLFVHLRSLTIWQNWVLGFVTFSLSCWKFYIEICWLFWHNSFFWIFSFFTFGARLMVCPVNWLQITFSQSNIELCLFR